MKKNEAQTEEKAGTFVIRARLTFLESVLGSLPQNEDIYRDYIGSKSPDAMKIEEEVEALGEEEVIKKSKTIFPRENGVPFVYDYQIKGFFKDTCSGLRKVDSSESSKIKAFKKEIDKLIFPMPRKIFFENVGEIGECQRPLRASTPQGERVSIAISEEIPAGASITFRVVCLCKDHLAAIREWLDYGIFSGLGQWRNSGHGRFVWEELDESGNVIGGNKSSIAA